MALDCEAGSTPQEGYMLRRGMQPSWDAAVSFRIPHAGHTDAIANTVSRTYHYVNGSS
jgi:hypothetical protein